MNASSEERKLRALWRTQDGRRQEPSVKISRGGDELIVKQDCSYLFRHPGLKGNPQDWTIDQYWKGQVHEIRTVANEEGGDPHILVDVVWFYSKEDIISQCQEKVKRFSVDLEGFEFLNCMSKQELCSSLTHDVNFADCIEWDVDIKLIDVNGKADLLQEPVVEYFVRACWDDVKLKFRGNRGCARKGCDKLWNPDKEEQRFCDFCGEWYDVSCLELVEGFSQEDKIQEIKTLDSGTRALPQSFFDTVAWQPIARGGPNHFVAGNIRIVRGCREFTHPEGRAKLLREHELEELSEEEDILGVLEDHFGLRQQDRGNPDYEQILVRDQLIYSCPNPACIEELLGSLTYM